MLVASSRNIQCTCTYSGYVASSAVFENWVENWVRNVQILQVFTTMVHYIRHIHTLTVIVHRTVESLNLTFGTLEVCSVLLRSLASTIILVVVAILCGMSMYVYVYAVFLSWLTDDPKTHQSQSRLTPSQLLSGKFSSSDNDLSSISVGPFHSLVCTCDPECVITCTVCVWEGDIITEDMYMYMTHDRCMCALVSSSE